MEALQPLDELRSAVEILPGRLCFQCLQQPFAVAGSPTAAAHICYYMDSDLIYEPFCADFGPCNLAHTYRFCQRVGLLLKQALPGQRVYLLVGAHPHKRSNAAALMGIFGVLMLGMTPEEAYAPVARLEPFVGFRDASCGMPSYQLPVLSVVRGMYRAKEVGFINWHRGEAFDVDEYEHFEQVENGDLNWIVPGKLMAFSGPSAQPKHFGGWRTYMPEDYIQYFRDRGVTAVVRLNKRMYEASRFTAHGVRHHEMYFPDGTCPTEPIMYRFLETVEREPGALAVHCKAGLGRTGVLICCYMIKHFGFSAEEATGYIRVCRPGSVIGPQQHYLLHYAPRLLEEGRVMRKAARAAEAAAEAPEVQRAARASIKVTADARAAADMALRGAVLVPQGSPLRRSARAAARAAAEAGDAPASRGASFSSQPSGDRGSSATAAQLSRMDLAQERDYLVSVPHATLPAAASPQKPGNARGAPVHIHVSVPDAPRVQAISYTVHSTAASRTASPAGTPSKVAPGAALAPAGSSASEDTTAAATPPRASTAATVLPPSSSKRMLAPNGQPRKIPMAMDFDQVAPTDLEDRDADEGWTVGSQLQQERFPPSSRVGALAAAAGRGATAFVEAFRSAMGAHRTSYSSRRNIGGS
eukprot:scaffold1.g5476.t1